MQLQHIINEFSSIENLLGHLSYTLTIISMLMRSMPWLRVFAISSGVVGMIYYLGMRADYVSAFWETFYVMVNVAQLFLLWYENRIGQFDGVERDFVSHALEDLKPVHAAKLLRQASHETIPANRVLVTEGRAPDRLFYVVSGEVQIAQGGVVVGKCAKGDFLGEMSLLSESDASATAVTVTHCELLAFDRPELERLLAKAEPVRHALHAGISRNLLEKIGRMNAFSVDMRTA